MPLWPWTYCSGVSPVWVRRWTSKWFLRLKDFPHVSQMKSLTPGDRRESYIFQRLQCHLRNFMVLGCDVFVRTWVDDHVAMQVIGEVKLLPTAWMRANFSPSFPVDQVDVILCSETKLIKSVVINRTVLSLTTDWLAVNEDFEKPSIIVIIIIYITPNNKFDLFAWSADFHLEAADGYVDLTAALVRTVEHLQHPVLLHDGTLSVPPGPGGHNDKHNYKWSGSALHSFKFCVFLAIWQQNVDDWLTYWDCVGNVSPLPASQC